MWEYVFNQIYIKKDGATKKEIQLFLERWNNDLNSKEILEINQRQKNSFTKNSKYYELYKPFDPKQWKIPKLELPNSYVEFLKYSDGGEFANGDRYLQFFSTKELRDMNLEYELPEYMEGAVSFAMDGCGNHLVFDMRNSSEDNEYPILASHSGSLGYEESWFIANSFQELCEGTKRIEDYDNRYD